MFRRNQEIQSTTTTNARVEVSSDLLPFLTKNAKRDGFTTDDSCSLTQSQSSYDVSCNDSINSYMDALSLQINKKLNILQSFITTNRSIHNNSNNNRHYSVSFAVHCTKRQRPIAPPYLNKHTEKLDSSNVFVRAQGKLDEWKKQIIMILFLVVSANILTMKSIGKETFHNSLSGPLPVKLTDSERVHYYYSSIRLDRSGSTIHDMLLAHAYVFQMQEKLIKSRQNHYDSELSNLNETWQLDLNPTGTINPDTHVFLPRTISDSAVTRLEYGGACLQVLPFYPRRKTIGLLKHLGLEKVLPIACPPQSFLLGSSQPTTSSNDVLSSSIILDEKNYRVHDSSLFSDTWRHYMRQQISTLRDNDNLHAIGIFNTSEWNGAMNSSMNDGVIESVITNSSKPFRIIVHIRRGDVEPCNFPTRYLPNSHYIRLIQKYWPIDKEEVQVIIYSVKKSYESFDSFLDQNYTVQFDTKFSTIWHDMMTADVVILSKSSFSFVPATFNLNLVIYTPFWHEPISSSNWIPVTDEYMNQTQTELEHLHEQACRLIPKKVRKHGTEKTYWKRFVWPYIKSFLHPKGQSP